MTVAKKVFLTFILLTSPLAGNMIAADTSHPEGLRFASYATSRHVERLATDQIIKGGFFSGRQTRGLALPVDVLEKIYYRNAARLYPRVEDVLVGLDYIKND
ncbi:MAG: hypothetical protein ACYSWO_05970 [Planctomycetota bacterium]